MLREKFSCHAFLVICRSQVFAGPWRKVEENEGEAWICGLTE
jgi:hypothetical protein